MRRIIENVILVACGLTIFIGEQMQRETTTWGGELLFLIACIAVAIWPEKEGQDD